MTMKPPMSISRIVVDTLLLIPVRDTELLKKPRQNLSDNAGASPL